jgi:cytochrome c biogenesis protein
MRDSPNEPFRYLRIPADDNDSVDEWMRLRGAIMNPQLRAEAAQRFARRYVERSAPKTKQETDELYGQLNDFCLKALSIFAGNDKEAGYVAVSRFLEKGPRDGQEKAAQIFIELLNGSLWDLWQAAREKDGLKAVELDDKHGRFLQLSATAFSDAFFYGAPVYLRLKEFEEVKESVLQVTRSPGKNLVYLGCLLLTLGVFSMLYIRERRLWIWLRSGDNGGTHALMAMSTQRRTLDFDKEFEGLKTQLLQSGPEQK